MSDLAGGADFACGCLRLFACGTAGRCSRRPLQHAGTDRGCVRPGRSPPAS